MRKREATLADFVDAAFYDGLTLLEMAVSTKNVDAISVFLRSGADPNVSTRSDRTPFLWAISTGSLEAVTAFIASKRVNLAGHAPGDPFRTTAMQAAGAAGDLPIIDALLSAGCQIDQKGRYGDTALHHALASDHSTAALLLINSGADVRALIPDSKLNPLIIAAMNVSDPRAVVRKLLEGGADPRFKSRGKTTALHAIAERAGMTECAEYLIKAGAEVDALENRAYALRTVVLREAPRPPRVHKLPSRVTPLIGAIATANVDMVRFLIGNHARPTLIFEPCDAHGFPRYDFEVTGTTEEDAFYDRGTPEATLQVLGVAYTGKPHPSLIADEAARRDYFVNGDPEIMPIPSRWQTSVHLAAERDSADIVDILARAGADVDAPDCMGESPLQMAIREGKFAAAESLAALTKFPEATWPIGHTLIGRVVASVKNITGPTCDRDHAERLMTKIVERGADPRAARTGAMARTTYDAIGDDRILRRIVARLGAGTADALYDCLRELQIPDLTEERSDPVMQRIIEAESILLDGTVDASDRRFDPHRKKIESLRESGRARRTATAMFVPECVAGSPLNDLAEEAKRMVFDLAVNPHGTITTVGYRRRK
jgi:ankyrin repeat protein